MTELLTVAEAAKRLDVSAASLRRWTDAGHVRCLRTPGGHRRYEPSELERFLWRLREKVEA